MRFGFLSANLGARPRSYLLDMGSQHFIASSSSAMWSGFARFSSCCGKRLPVEMPIVLFAGAHEMERFEHLRLSSLFDESRFLMRAKLPYLDFLRVLGRAEFVVTDSGGLQEECAYLAFRVWCTGSGPSVIRGSPKTWSFPAWRQASWATS